ncbi:hypothetical protein SO802_017721 [Lithocarpus litseifolius]|uniref:Uncharacterized protein n=1 Tax=Lithocarpus litseifolius TaxID=425828 RepID=A0AAW2CKU8_9ROSI
MVIEELPSPPLTRKGKEKKGESIWIDPTTTLRQTHNVISDDKLKALSSIPSHKLVSYHVHMLVQVLGESLRLTINYLLKEEKVVMVNSRVELEKAVADFHASGAFGIITFDEFFKGFKLWQRWTMKHLSTTIDYSNLDFEGIDKEMMANERARANEKAGVE